MKKPGVPQYNPLRAAQSRAARALQRYAFEAEDVRWYHQNASAATGNRATNPGKVVIQSSRGEASWPDLSAASRHRRVHARLMTLSGAQQEALALYYAAHRRAGEIESYFGPLVNIVIARYPIREHEAPAKLGGRNPTREEMLVKIVASSTIKVAIVMDPGPPEIRGMRELRVVLRDEAERVFADALTAYAGGDADDMAEGARTPYEPRPYRPRPRRDVLATLPEETMK